MMQDPRDKTPGALLQTRQGGRSWMWSEWAGAMYYGTFIVKELADGTITTMWEGRDPGAGKLTPPVDHSPRGGDWTTSR